MNKFATDDKRNQTSIGIDQTGIGTTGIFLKTVNCKYQPIKS
ncbi:hypothetical protein [Spiroplasma kunkelii]|nr:hypothetical protein [Spiroplasma kunkelii]